MAILKIKAKATPGYPGWWQAGIFFPKDQVVEVDEAKLSKKQIESLHREDGKMISILKAEPQRETVPAGKKEK